MTPEDFSRILQAQDGKCAICHTPEEECRGGLVVDHNHSTSTHRGLLCRVCNAALGIFGDSREILESAIEYLDAYECPSQAPDVAGEIA